MSTAAAVAGAAASTRGVADVRIAVLDMRSNLDFLRAAEARDKWDPPWLFRQVRADVVDLTKGLIDKFGSAGKAW